MCSWCRRPTRLDTRVMPDEPFRVLREVRQPTPQRCSAEVSRSKSHGMDTKRHRLGLGRRSILAWIHRFEGHVSVRSQICQKRHGVPLTTRCGRSVPRTRSWVRCWVWGRDVLREVTVRVGRWPWQRRAGQPLHASLCDGVGAAADGSCRRAARLSALRKAICAAVAASAPRRAIGYRRDGGARDRPTSGDAACAAGFWP